MISVLVVAQYFPYPPQHGAAVDIWGQIQTLRSLGCLVDLVATDLVAPTPEDLTAVRTKVDQFWFVQRTPGMRSALGIQPYQVLTRAGLDTVPLQREYDVVLLQSEYVLEILKNPGLRAKHAVLRVHNHEARYFSQLSQSATSLYRKLFYTAESFKFRSFSRRAMQRCNQLWFISDHEREEHSRLVPGDAKKCYFVPPSVDLNAMSPYPGPGKSAIFVGSLTIPMNVDGLRWYIERVHPELGRTEGYQLIIAGHTKGYPIDWLRDLAARSPNIQLHTDLPDLGPLYSSASVFVNPILSGAGLKLKTIRAIEAGLPVVTTEIGVEGTGLRDGEHVVLADSPAEFAASTRALLCDGERAQKIVRSAQAFLAQMYNQEARIGHLLADLMAQ